MGIPASSASKELNVFNESELLPLSALQHILFCERQCAFIHIEQLWSENRLTVEGKLLHDHVHSEDAETRSDVRIVRGLRLRSLILGVSGVADVVEFHLLPDNTNGAAVPLPDRSGFWKPFPVEYKRGKPKPDHSDEVQLCAQAICIEEMMNVQILAGALFYGKTRHRHPVEFTPELRDTTKQAAERLHQLVRSGKTPNAVREPKCTNCSLVEQCMPGIVGSGQSAEAYILAVIKG